jgi:hypothetical protein
VTFDRAFADLAGKGSSDQWRFTRDTLEVHRGEAVTASTGRGGEPHTFTDVTDTGCVPAINRVLFGRPDPSAKCMAVDPASGLPAVILQTGLLPGRTVDVDTSARATRLDDCMIQSWMRTTVTVD